MKFYRKIFEKALGSPFEGVESGSGGRPQPLASIRRKRPDAKNWDKSPGKTGGERSDDGMVLDLFLQSGRTRENEVRCLPDQGVAREEPGEAARAVRDGQAKAIWS
jgi:hypothetical protein